MGSTGELILFLTPVLLVYLYVKLNDVKLSNIPPEVWSQATGNFSPENILSTATRLKEFPPQINSRLPPRTGRRYIIVGGSGFLGGWIVNHLLTRGEDPKNIRILDIRAPTRSDITQGPGKLVEFAQIDVADKDSVIAGFTEPWPPEASQDANITVFCTAANIRFYEKHPALLPRSLRVNVTGLEHVIKGSLHCGATILVATSSGSLGVRSSRFLLTPWESQPKFFAQVLRDDTAESTRPHCTFASNYAYSKMVGEARVLAADKSSGAGGKYLRTGAIRPGNGVYGVGGDQIAENSLKNPDVRLTWLPNTVQHFIFVENCSLAHLCYEQRLVELADGGQNPDIGGKPFIVTDAGPPAAYGDCYRVLETLTDVRFRVLSPTLMLLLAYMVQAYHLTTHFLSQSPNVFLRTAGAFLPQLSSLVANFQPPVWNVTNSHLIFDSSNARASPDAGGLGYEPTVLDYQSGRVVDHGHASGGGNSSFVTCVKWLREVVFLSPVTLVSRDRRDLLSHRSKVSMT
ncbi:NAD-P-binding protein [Thelephora terrestris]|uniref:NAD-P-binding protein n=1 Tax=Thelephora terrestris TaxID=56493 RepID=A0A9P6HP84_9AGAM|nr:NAD-P-binding protein [Thelephora terrestris]